MTPRDSLVDLFLVHFIDHRTNYCRVFLEMSKNTAAQKFKHIMFFFERSLTFVFCILRTDGGGEHRTLDLFCKDTNSARHIIEARNQASNVLAQRMHGTIMNMVRSMVFVCGLLLSIWGDVSEYAAYIRNRRPSKENSGRQ